VHIFAALRSPYWIRHFGYQFFDPISFKSMRNMIYTHKMFIKMNNPSENPENNWIVVLFWQSYWIHHFGN